MLPNRKGGGFERSAHALGQANGFVLSRIWQQTRQLHTSDPAKKIIRSQVRSRKKPICPVVPTCLVSNEREQRKSSRVSGANRSDGGRQASVVGAIASGYCAMLISMPERRPKGAGMHGSERIYPCPEGSGGGSARSIMPLLLNEVPRDARQSLRVSLSISS
jgi:hypothetical protein